MTVVNIFVNYQDLPSGGVSYLYNKYIYILLISDQYTAYKNNNIGTESSRVYYLFKRQKKRGSP